MAEEPNGDIKALDAPADVSIKAYADGWTLVPGSAEKVVTFTFKAPLRLALNIYVLLPELLSNNEGAATFIAKNGVTGSYNSVLSGSNVVIEHNPTFNGAVQSGDFLHLTAAGENKDGIRLSDLDVTFKFANGITKAGEEIPISAYLIAGDVTTEINEDLAITAVPNDSWSIEKGVVLEKVPPAFTEGKFIERPYTDIGNGDTYPITYKLSLKTTGNTNTEGRIYQKDLSVVDTISGYFEGIENAPVIDSVRYDNPDTGTIIPEGEGGYTYTPGTESSTLSFTVPGSESAPTNNRDIYVTVLVNEDTYTNSATLAPILPSGLAKLSNTAQLTTNPVVGVPEDKDLDEPVETFFGWTQQETDKPKLTINKQIEAKNLLPTAYTEALRLLYGYEATAVNDNAKVRFTLTEKDHPGDPNYTQELTIGPEGNVVSEELLPGEYTLTETIGIGGTFAIDGLATATIVVSGPDAQGHSTFVSEGSDSRLEGNTITIVSKSTAVGDLKVKVEKQKPYEIEMFEAFENKAITLTGSDFTQTATTNNLGEAIFHNVPSSGEPYTLTGADEEGFVIEPEGGVTGITLSSSLADATLRYAKGSGSFKLSKSFKGPFSDSTVAARADAHVVIELFKKEDETYVSSGITFRIPEDITSSGVVQKDIPKGTYYLKETSLKFGTGGEDDEYDRIDPTDGVKVTIKGGYYYAGPTGPADLLLHDEKTADPDDDTYTLVNKSTYGELAVQSFWVDRSDDSSDNPINNDKFTAKNTDTNKTYTLATGADGIAKLNVPAGDYKITRTTALGTTEVNTDLKNTESVSVAANTHAELGYEVTGQALNAEKVQTAGFVKAKLPNVTGTKSTPVLETPVAGATFTLFKLNEDTSKYEVQSSPAPKTGTPFTFEGLKAGTYIAVETGVPANYEAPAWRSYFYNGTALQSSVEESTLPANVPKVVITTGDYQSTAVGAAKSLSFSPRNVVNVPSTELKIKTVQAMTGVNLPGTAKYEVYEYDDINSTYFAEPYTSATVATGTTPSFPNRLLAGHKYKVVQTEISDSTYVLSDDYLEITLDANADKTYTWNGSPRRANTLPATTTGSTGDLATSVTVQFSNAKKPVIRIDKLGETQEIDSRTGTNEREQLGGAVFKLYYEESGVDFYAGSDGTWKKTNSGEVVTDATGNLVLPTGLTFDPNPNKDYKLLELSAPAVPGAPDLEYKMPSNPIEFAFGYVVYAENANYHAEYELKDADSDWSDDIKVDYVGNSITITNVLEPHYLSLQKLALKTKKYAFESDPDNVGIPYQGADGDEIDPASAAEPAMILGGSFIVKRWRGGNDNPPSDADMDNSSLWYDVSAWLDMGNNPDNLEGARGYSGNLPAGYYMVTERWRDDTGNGEDTDLYINKGGDYHKSGNTWTADTDSNAPNWKPAPKQLKFIVDLTGTDPDDIYKNIQVGNTGMLNNALGGGAYNGDTLVQLTGTKTSWTQLTDSIQYNGLLNGVKFDLYPAYKDAAGNYVKFGPPIQHTIESGNLWGSGTWGSDKPDPGRFSSIKFFIAKSILDYINGNEEPPEGYTGTYTKYVDLSADAKAAVAELVAMTGPKTEPTSEWVSTEDFHLALEEIGGLPANFTQSYPKTFGIDIPRNGLQHNYDNKNIRAEDDEVAEEGIFDTTLSDTEKYAETKSIKNLRGESRLELLKVAYENRTPANIVNGKLQSVSNSFALYKAESAAPDATKQFLKNITPQSTRNNYEKLEPGYYYLKELTAPANFNISGSYRIVAPKADGTTGEIPAYNANNAANKPFDEGDYIGPLVLTDNTKGNTIVAVTDHPFGQIKLTNYWNGVAKSDTALTATYEFVETPAGFTVSTNTLTGTNVEVATGGNDKAFTIKANAVAAFKNLPDGDYKIKLTHISGDDTNPATSGAAFAHTANAALKGTDYLSFKVEKGIAKALKVGEAELNTAMDVSTAAKAEATFVTTNKKGLGQASTGEANTPLQVFTVYVNHPGKGSLVIRKDVVLANGETNTANTFFKDGTYQASKVPNDFVAHFTATPVDSSGQATGSPINITWSKAAVAADANGKNYGEIVTPLDAGVYEVKEVGPAPTGYHIAGSPAAAPVYVKVEPPTTVSGFVYATNAPSSGAGSTAENPITNNNATKPVFYNYSDQGKLTIVKYGSATTPVALAGAQFEIYKTSTGSGDPVATIAPASGTDYSVNLDADEDGTSYWIKEIKAPANHSLRDDLVKVTVKPHTNPTGTFTNTLPAYNVDDAKGAQEKTNKIAILDAPLTQISVAKETVYDEITEGATTIVESERARVSGLSLQIFKEVASAGEGIISTPEGSSTSHWKLVETHDTNGEGGYYEFKNLGIGRYRVFETVDAGHNYLATNVDFTALQNTPIITITHNTEDNTLDVVSDDIANYPIGVTLADLQDYQKDHPEEKVIPKGAVAGWYPKNLMIITNGFRGIRFTAKKVDYDDTDKVLSGATFALYRKSWVDGEGKEHPDEKMFNTAPSNGNITTDADGLAIFPPVYIENNAEYYLKEISPKAEYVASEYYDSVSKDVTYSKQDGNPGPVAVFKNKKLAASTIGITKSTSVTAADKPLSEEGFGTTYTLTPAAANNVLPMEKYAVEDDGIVFKGGDTPTEFNGTQPEYAYTKVRIFPSTAKITPEGSDAPVLVKVNNLAWAEFDPQEDFIEVELDAGTKSLNVQYSQENPGAGTPTVGFDFKPGKIEIDTVFTKFIPANDQPEITQIDNTATVSAWTSNATDKDLKKITATSTPTVIALSTDPRPDVEISKKLTNKYPLPSDGKGYAPSKEGEPTLVEYEIALKNNGDKNLLNNLPLQEPIVVDYLPEGMSIALDGDSKPIYTVEGTDETGEATFSQSGNAVVWKFPGYLKEGGVITVKVTTVLSQIVVSDTLVNTAYGTSAKTPLIPSAPKFPTGASFTTSMGSESVVSATESSNATEYAKLTAIPALKGENINGTDKGLGLFVKATTSIPVKKTGDIRHLKSVSVNGEAWYSGTIPQDVYPGDVISYSFVLSNGFPAGVVKNVENVRISDTLPTEWTPLTSGWTWDEAVVKLSSQSAPLVAPEDYEITSPDGGKTFNFVLKKNGGKLGNSDVLTVEYKTTALPAETEITPQVYEDNARVVAKNQGTFSFFYTGEEQNDTSNEVSTIFNAPDVALDGVAWDDKDYDGIEGSSLDGPAPGAEVSVWSNAGGTWHSVATDTADANGEYSFDGLTSSYGYDPAIQYQLRYVFPAASYAGYQFTDSDNDSDVTTSDVVEGVLTGKTDAFTLNVSGTKNAGVYKLSALEGTVWYDTDKDGVLDADENKKVEKVKVSLFKSKADAEAGTNKVGSTVITDENGYSFTGLRTGAYVDSVWTPYEYYLTFDKADVKHAKETYNWSPLGHDSIAKPTPTDSDFSSNTAISDSATKLEYGLTNSATHAGIVAVPKTLDGVVWEDKNYDGNQDEVDTELENVVVNLYQSADGGNTYDEDVYSTTKTNADGTYSFTGEKQDGKGVDLGTDKAYKVEFIAPASSGLHSWFFSTDDVIEGIDDQVHDLDAGLYQNSAVTGTVYRDINDNGSQDSGEPGVEGVNVTLRGTDITEAAVEATFETGENGEYVFGADDKLKKAAEGGYVLTFDKGNLVTDLESYKWAILPSATPVTDRYGDEATEAIAELDYAAIADEENAGIVPYVHISGFAWTDAKQNGKRDDAEAALKGISVRLVDSKDKVVGRTTTDAEGQYIFDEILSGTVAPVAGKGNANYSVEFVNPDNDKFTWTVAGKDHAATAMKGKSASGGLVNDYQRASTAPVNNGVNSENKLNAGLRDTPEYTVTYLPNGGAGDWGTGAATITLKPGRLVPTQVVARDGYEFLGWYLTPALSEWSFGTGKMPANNITLMAQWEEIPVILPIPTPTPTDGGTVIAAAGGAATPTFAQQVADDLEIPDPTVPLDPGTTIDDGDTPRGTTGDWSLISLVLSFLAILSAVMLIIRGIKYSRSIGYAKDADDDENNHPARRRISLILSVLAGIVTPAVWLYFDNLTQPMVMVNRWTLVVAIIFIVNLIAHVVYRKNTRKLEEKEDTIALA
jgi:uncharacterized repeat protein (TIGR02543 family)